MPTGLPAPVHPTRAAAHRRTARVSGAEAIADLAIAGVAPGHAPSLEALRADPSWSAVSEMLRRCGANEEEALPRLARYVASLLIWNRTVSNLVSRADEDRIVSRHLLECLEPAAELRASGARRWIDLGSGAGLPALPLAIAGVGERWTLVESRRPKTLFMLKALQDIGLEKIAIEHGRLESYAAADAASVDDTQPVLRRCEGFTSRATLRLAPTLEMARPFVIPGGRAFLWKGSRRGEEIADRDSWSSAWDFVREITLESSQSVVLEFSRKDD